MAAVLRTLSVSIQMVPFTAALVSQATLVISMSDAQIVLESALMGQNVTRTLTASNQWAEATIFASVKLAGPEMVRSVAPTEIWMDGQTLIYRVRKKDAEWTIVLTLLTLARKTVMVMESEMLVMMMLIMMEFPILLTIVHLWLIQISLTLTLKVKTNVVMLVITVLSYLIWTKKILTRMVWEMPVILTKTMTAFSMKVIIVCS
jgi:hypothetical protein